MHFAVNDRGEAVLRIADDVLPDVQNRPARRVDERAALVHEPRHVAHRDAEGGKDHDVVRSERIPALSRIAEEPDVGGAQLIVDVRVVDDLAGEEDVPSREAAARLIRVIDRAVHSVAEPELAREVNREAAGGVAGSRCCGRDRRWRCGRPPPAPRRRRPSCRGLCGRSKAGKAPRTYLA